MYDHLKEIIQNRHEASMRRTHLHLFLLIASLCTSFAAGLAQTASKDEAQIRSIVASEGDAWNRGDAEAFAAHYAEDGSFTNVIGEQLHGRKAFIAQHQMIFSTIYKGSHNVFNVSKVTFLRPDVALVEIDGALSGTNALPPGMKLSNDGALHVKLLEVMAREKGVWSIAAFHNVAVYPLRAGGPPQR